MFVNKHSNFLALGFLTGVNVRGTLVLDRLRCPIDKNHIFVLGHSGACLYFYDKLCKSYFLYSRS